MAQLVSEMSGYVKSVQLMDFAVAMSAKVVGVGCG